MLKDVGWTVPKIREMRYMLTMCSQDMYRGWWHAAITTYITPHKNAYGYACWIPSDILLHTYTCPLFLCLCSEHTLCVSVRCSIIWSAGEMYVYVNSKAWFLDSKFGKICKINLVMIGKCLNSMSLYMYVTHSLMLFPPHPPTIIILSGDGQIFIAFILPVDMEPIFNHCPLTSYCNLSWQRVWYAWFQISMLLHKLVQV